MTGFRSYFKMEINVLIYHRANNTALFKTSKHRMTRLYVGLSQLIQISCHAVYDMFYLAFEKNVEGNLSAFNLIKCI